MQWQRKLPPPLLQGESPPSRLCASAEQPFPISVFFIIPEAGTPRNRHAKVFSCNFPVHMVFCICLNLPVCWNW